MFKVFTIKNILYLDLFDEMSNLEITISQDLIDGKLPVYKSILYRDDLKRLDGVLGFCQKHKLLSKEKFIFLSSKLDELIASFCDKCSLDYYS